MKKLFLLFPMITMLLVGCSANNPKIRDPELKVKCPDIVFLNKISYNPYSNSDSDYLITFFDKDGNYYSTTDTEICQLSFPELVERFQKGDKRFEKRPQTCDVGELEKNYISVYHEICESQIAGNKIELDEPMEFPAVEADSWSTYMLYYATDGTETIDAQIIHANKCMTNIETNNSTVNSAYGWYQDSVRMNSAQTETTAPTSNITIEPLEYQSMGGSLYYTETLIQEKARDGDEDRILRCMKTICDYFSQHYDYDILIANFNYDSENNLVFNGYAMVNGVKINDVFFSVDMYGMEMDEDIYFQRNDFINPDKIQLDNIISQSQMLEIALPLAEAHKDEIIDRFSSEKNVPIEGNYRMEYDSENGLVYHIRLGTNGRHNSYIVIDAHTGEVKDSLFFDGVIVD
ncbi:MAG TPA: hypothetical protein DCO72_09185 [Ruminococcus sp.]|nr:hypothetical protein [Ruminococcus sp.]